MGLYWKNKVSKDERNPWQDYTDVRDSLRVEVKVMTLKSLLANVGCNILSQDKMLNENILKRQRYLKEDMRPSETLVIAAVSGYLTYNPFQWPK